MGRGAIVIGLAAVIIGQVLFGKLRGNFAFTLLTVVFGAIIYYLVLQVVLWMGLNSNDLKLLFCTGGCCFPGNSLHERKIFFEKCKEGELTMLEIKDIHKTFNAGTVNEKRALNGVNLHLEEGDFVTIIGGNGAGKSTTLNAVSRGMAGGCWTHLHRRDGCYQTARTQACKIFGKSFSGSYDRNCSWNAD